VPAAHQFKAHRLPVVVNSVRQTINTVREDAREIGVAGRLPSIERHWLALIAAMLVVFACFFAIGSMGHPSSAPSGEPPSTLHAASVRAAIPIALGSVPPIEANKALEAIAVANRRATPRPSEPAVAIARSLTAVPASVQPVVSEASSPVSGEQAAPTSSSEPAHSESAPPAQAPKPSRPAGTSGNGHSRSSSGGGSFDSSG
jgi:hypothetical protein